MKKLTIKEFIEKASKIHNNKYNYSLTRYINSRCKVIIICPHHGKFEQMPSNHLKGHGCSWCSGFPRYNTKSFIEKASKVHNNKYNYSETKYIDAKTPIFIICPCHGKFEQAPYIHINGHGCLLCGNRSMLKKDFIKAANEIHNNKYKYKDFVSLSLKATIICPIHGEFKQTAGLHLKGNSCRKCASQKYFEEDFKKMAKKIHKDKYDYSKMDYIDSRHKIEIICPLHGSFMQEPRFHLRGCGCPKCVGTISNISQKWLDKLNIPVKHREKTLKMGKRRFVVDALDNDNKIVYEFYGDYWHGNPQKFAPNDINPSCKKTYGELYRNTLTREKEIKDAGYKIISIWESEII